MQDKLKKSISKSERLAGLFERERELQFFSSGHESQGAGQFSRHLVSAELYCSVQCVRYNSGTFFEKNFMGTIFKEKQKKFKHENLYSLYESVSFRTVRTFCWWHEKRGGHEN